MKEYKGWELIKMANEGKIKNDEEFKKVDGDLYIKFVNSDDKFSFRTKANIEVGNSFFTRNNIFIKIQKSLTFFEAMAKADEGEKVTNDYLKDKNGNYTGYYLKKDNKLYYYVSSGNAGSVYEINEDEMISYWYIYED